MTPVVAPFTGAAHPIRGVNGGGVPWQIDRGRGELSSDGRLKIRVEGVVLVSSGQNPVPMFRGVVNWLTTEPPDVGENLATAPVPASSDGDATIKATLDLPDPCVAPIVFVTSGTGPPRATGSRRRAASAGQSAPCGLSALTRPQSRRWPGRPDRR